MVPLMPEEPASHAKETHMNTITKTAIVAVMTGTLGFAAVVPSFAQSAPSQSQNQLQFKGDRQQHNNGPRHGGMGPMGGDILGFERGAEAVEIALVRLSHAVELTAEQQPLFDTFKADALTAATTFGDAVEGLRPTPPTDDTAATAERPGFADRLETRIALEKAHLAALEAIQPSATAFFDSLTEEQLAQLTPERGPNGMPGQDGPRHRGEHGKPGPMGVPGAGPADGETPPAPPAPEADAPTNG